LLGVGVGVISDFIDRVSCLDGGRVLVI
jgi:hypothetical protein